MRLITTVTLFFLYISICAAGQIYCPASLVCDYVAGQCSEPNDWVLDSGSGMEPFSGQKNLSLTRIWAYKQGAYYQFECQYDYSNHSSISIYTYVKKLDGTGWVFSGFGNQLAECTNIIDPSSCVGYK